MGPMRRASSGFSTAQGAMAGQDSQERGGAAWLVNSDGDETVEMTQTEILRARRDGSITESTLVWRQGLSEWTPVGEVPQLSIAANGGAGAAESDAAAPEQEQRLREDDVTELCAEHAQQQQDFEAPPTVGYGEHDAELLSENDVSEVGPEDAQHRRDSEPSLTFGYGELDEDLPEDEVTGVWGQNAQPLSLPDAPATVVVLDDLDLASEPEAAQAAADPSLAGMTENTPAAPVSYADLARETVPEDEVSEAEGRPQDAPAAATQFAPPHPPYASRWQGGELSRRETIPSIARTAELEAALAAAKRLRERRGGIPTASPARRGGLQFLLEGLRGFRDALRAAARWLTLLGRPGRRTLS